MKISDLQTFDYLLKRLGEMSNNHFRLVTKIDNDYWVGDYIECYNSGSIVLKHIDFSSHARDQFISSEQDEYSGYTAQQIFESVDIMLKSDNSEYDHLLNYIYRTDTSALKANLVFDFILDILGKVESNNNLPNYLFNPTKLGEATPYSLPILKLSETFSLEPVSIIIEPSQS